VCTHVLLPGKCRNLQGSPGTRATAHGAGAHTEAHPLLAEVFERGPRRSLPDPDGEQDVLSWLRERQVASGPELEVRLVDLPEAARAGQLTVPSGFSHLHVGGETAARLGGPSFDRHP
jgi:hypothetical protein